MEQNSNRRKLSIRDLLIATSLIAVGFAMAATISSPDNLAYLLDHHNAAGIMMIACFYGTVGFPVLISLIGFLVLRKSKSPLKMLYAFLVLILAVESIVFAMTVAEACAFEIV